MNSKQNAKEISENIKNFIAQVFSKYYGVVLIIWKYCTLPLDLSVSQSMDRCWACGRCTRSWKIDWQRSYSTRQLINVLAWKTTWTKSQKIPSIPHYLLSFLNISGDIQLVSLIKFAWLAIWKSKMATGIISWVKGLATSV